MQTENAVSPILIFNLAFIFILKQSYMKPKKHTIWILSSSFNLRGRWKKYGKLAFTSKIHIYSFLKYINILCAYKLHYMVTRNLHSVNSVKQTALLQQNTFKALYYIAINKLLSSKLFYENFFYKDSIQACDP